MNEMMEIFEQLNLSGMEEEVLLAVGGVMLVGLLISGILNLAVYILKALGIYTAAKRRGIGHAWLAWIPVADYWVVGSLSDQYKRTVKNKSSYNRTILLVLAVLTYVVAWIINGIYLGGVAESLESALDGDMESLIFALTMAGGSGGVLDLLHSGLDLALTVFWHIALYDVYCAANPRYSVMFLVLGIIFPITIPFFLFFNRKKDEGMRIHEPETVPGT